MSPDNWTTCPNCRAKDQAGELLGSLPPTLREDWDLGMNRAGEFEVIYSCSCKVCGWAWKHRHFEIVNKAFSDTGETP